HLHPIKHAKQTFETILPEIPRGSYRLYADVTYETGFSDTLTTTVDIPEPSAGGGISSSLMPPDPDDSWRIAPIFDADHISHECPLAGGNVMTWRAPGRIAANQPISLQFAV